MEKVKYEAKAKKIWQKAKDAIELDNSNLSEKDQLALVLELYKKRKQQLQLN